MKAVRCLVLVCLVLFCFAPKVGAWSAIESVGRFKSTHNTIVRIAYGYLRKDTAFSKANFPFLKPILQSDVVPLPGSNTPGTGPDVDGASFFSEHYYNPTNKQGKAPQAVAHYFGDLVKNLNGYKTKAHKFKNSSWAAHYLADMHVPYHVVGTSSQVAVGRRQRPVFTEAETGPHELFKDPRYPLQPFPGLGWGAGNNFFKALAFYMHHNPKGSKADWFDPWYYNGWVELPIEKLQVIGGSHANWEFDVVLRVSDKQITNQLDYIIAKQGFYEPAWKNKRAKWGKQFYLRASQQAVEYTKAIADRTRKHIPAIWEKPVLGIAYAVRSVYTLYRASFTSINPRITGRVNKKGINEILVDIENTSSISALKNIEARLSLKGQSQVLKYKGIISPHTMGRIVFLVSSTMNQTVDAAVEVRADHEKCPDLGYKKVLFHIKLAKNPNSGGNAGGGSGGSSADASASGNPPGFEQTENGGSCPRRNPGNRGSYKINARPFDQKGKYTRCFYQYAGNTMLSAEHPFKNNKLHGNYKVYQNTSPYRLSVSRQYVDGQLHGMDLTWSTDRKSNKYYLLKKQNYSNGKLNYSFTFYKSGGVKVKTKYVNGRASMSYNYNDHGQMTYCTKWDSNRRPRDCKTGKLR